VDLSRRHLRGDGKSLTVNNHVDFASESASRAPQCMVAGFFRSAAEAFFDAPAADREARTLLPSMQNRSQSIFPSRSSRIWRASKIRSYVPLERHWLKYSYADCHGPYRSGRSRQGAPVRRIHKTAFSISRAERLGRPVRAGSTVIDDATTAHCSSVISCRCAMGRFPFLYRVYRHNGGFSDRA
jgi:hypothetical protein